MEWCPGNQFNVSQFQTNGTCVSSGTCPPNVVSKTCVPLIIQITGCPDNCTYNGVCTNVTLPPSCSNGVVDGNETDVDCGGVCNGCGSSQKCRNTTDCLSFYCDNTTFTCGGSGFYNVGGNTTQKCVCRTGFSGSNCANSALVPFNRELAVESALGAAAVVGIVIAIILFVACTGAGSYAAYNRLNIDNMSGTRSNPLYKGTGNSGQNPLYKGAT